jgi:hypothetical protein
MALSRHGGAMREQVTSLHFTVFTSLGWRLELLSNTHDFISGASLHHESNVKASMTTFPLHKEKICRPMRSNTVSRRAGWLIAAAH